MASIYNLDTTDNLTPEQQSLILECTGNIWCEWIPSNARMQYMAIPRLLAIAELGWSKTGAKRLECLQTTPVWSVWTSQYHGYQLPYTDLEGFNAVNAFIGEGTINVTCLDPLRKFTIPLMAVLPALQSPVYEGPIKWLKPQTLLSAPSALMERKVT